METVSNACLKEKIAEIDLGCVYLRMIHKYNFEPSSAQKAIDEYRTYLLLLSEGIVSSPNVAVRTVWEIHILFLSRYVRDCMEIFGKVIWYEPEPLPNNISERNKCRQRLQTSIQNILTVNCDQYLILVPNEETPSPEFQSKIEKLRSLSLKPPP